MPSCPGYRWFAGETYLKIAGRWAYLYRAVDQHGQVIDVLLPARRDLAAARHFFTQAMRIGTVPAEVTTGRRRGHYDIATGVPSRHLLRATFDDLAIII